MFYLPTATLFILCFKKNVLVYFLLFVLCCQYQCKWLPGKTRLWNDLLCVLTHSLTSANTCSDMEAWLHGDTSWEMCLASTRILRCEQIFMNLLKTTNTYIVKYCQDQFGSKLLSDFIHYLYRIKKFVVKLQVSSHV